MTSTELMKKLDNYWYYYKWHTYFGIAILIVILFCVAQSVFNVNPDNSIMLVSKTSPLPPDVSNSIKNDLSQYVIDINKDGKKSLSIMSFDFSSYSPSVLLASQVKLQGELGKSNSFIFLIDDGSYKDNINQGYFDKIKAVIPNAQTIDDYRISASSLSVFKDKSYKDDLKNYYLVIRKYKGSKVESPISLIAYQNDMNFLKRILAESNTISN